jgi:hypothetical protein
VEENVERPPTIRQTLLGQFDKCPRSGYLSLKYGGGSSTHAQARGTAFHDMAERATREMIDNGEVEYPPELARDLMQQVLDERTDLVVPVGEHESLRSMAWNWAKASNEILRPRGFLVGIERQVALELDGWTLTGTLDLSFIEGNEGRVKDYKTGFIIPKQEQFERQFQAPFYGLLQAEGRFVEEELDDGTLVLGDRVSKHPLDGVHAHQLYPRHLYCLTCKKEECVCDGPANFALDGRYAFYDLGDLAAFKVSVSALLKRIEAGLTEGDYPAVAGDHCGLCPAPHECPIPEQFRDVQEVTSLEDAMGALSRVEGMTVEVNRLKRSVRAYADAQELEAIPLSPDSDLEYGFVTVRSEPVKDKDRLKQALAKQEGNPEDFFTTRTSVRFDRRRRDT